MQLAPADCFSQDVAAVVLIRRPHGETLKIFEYILPDATRDSLATAKAIRKGALEALLPEPEIRAGICDGMRLLHLALLLKRDAPLVHLLLLKNPEIIRTVDGLGRYPLVIAVKVSHSQQHGSRELLTTDDRLSLTYGTHLSPPRQTHPTK